MVKSFQLIALQQSHKLAESDQIIKDNNLILKLSYFFLVLHSLVN
jgi:hypothetical protein